MQHDANTTLADLKHQVAIFINERDWEQFHDPKSLSMALAIEAAELMEHVKWAGSRQEAFDQVAEKRTEICHELADVLHAVLAFAHSCNIDLTQALQEKMGINAEKYPIEKAKGLTKKYTQL